MLKKYSLCLGIILIFLSGCTTLINNSSWREIENDLIYISDISKEGFYAPIPLSEITDVLRKYRTKYESTNNDKITPEILSNTIYNWTYRYFKKNNPQSGSIYEFQRKETLLLEDLRKIRGSFIDLSPVHHKELITDQFNPFISKLENSIAERTEIINEIEAEKEKKE